MILQQPTRSRSPVSGAFKVNVDAAESKDMLRAGAGAIIRDSDGQLIGSVAKNTSPCFSVFALEVIAKREGIQFAREIGVYDVIIETDCLQAFMDIRDEGTRASIAGHIVEEIDHLVCNFHSVSWSFVKRDGNYAAHALSLCEESLWREDSPSFLQYGIQLDAY